MRSRLLATCKRRDVSGIPADRLPSAGTFTLSALNADRGAGAGAGQAPPPDAGLSVAAFGTGAWFTSPGKMQRLNAGDTASTRACKLEVIFSRFATPRACLQPDDENDEIRHSTRQRNESDMQRTVPRGVELSAPLSVQKSAIPFRAAVVPGTVHATQPTISALAHWQTATCTCIV